MHGYDRAVMLIPAWFLLLVWVIGAAFTVTGTLTNDLVSPALDRRPRAHRHADRFHDHAEPPSPAARLGRRRIRHRAQGARLDRQRRHRFSTGTWPPTASMSVPRSRRNWALPAARSKGRPRPGSMSCIRPRRDRFRACLDTMLEQRRGRINQEFRLRADDADYFWFRLKARPVVGADGEVVRIVGTPGGHHRGKDRRGAATARRRA